MKKGNKRNNYNDRDREFSGYDKKPASTAAELP